MPQAQEVHAGSVRVIASEQVAISMGREWSDRCRLIIACWASRHARLSQPGHHSRVQVVLLVTCSYESLALR